MRLLSLLKNELLKLVNKYESIKMIIDSQLVEWIRGDAIWKTIKKNRTMNEIEYNFSTRYRVGITRSQWSSIFGEEVVQSIIRQLGGEILSIHPRVQGFNRHILDIETKNAYIEVKTRNYTTNGTAGEKIYGAPHKYRDVYMTTGKPLLVILVGYQEQEATNKMKLFTQETYSYRRFLWEEYRVKYIKCSELLEGKHTHLL